MQQKKHWRILKMTLKKKVIIPIFIPHKGCPFDCVFCNQKSISGETKDVTTQDITNTIDTFLQTIDKQIIPQVAFYGGSFTGIDIKEQTKFLECVYEYVKKGKVSSIRLSTRPDYINHDILTNLKKYGVSTIELGVQSLNPEVLKLSHRGHTVSDVKNAVKLIKEYGFSLGIQTMIGLLGDTRDSAIDTAKQVVEMKPDCVRIYPTMVIKNTYLNTLLKQGKYVPLTLEEAVSICADLCEIYYRNNINVIRIGLQPTDNITEGKDVVGGPFHPSMRQLVEERLFRTRIEQEIVKKGLKEHLDVYVDDRYISQVVGQKKTNKKYFRDKFGIRRIKVHGIKEKGFDYLRVQ